MGDFSTNSNNNNEGAFKFKLPEFNNIDANKIVRKPNSSGPEFIPYNQKRGRDIFSRVSFNTGVLWLSGFTGGGLYGVGYGWRNAPHPSFKVKANSVLNGMSKYGSSAGSFLGVAAFLHTLSLWGADKFEDEYLPAALSSDHFSPIVGGLLPGALMFLHRGPRAATLAAAIGATVSWTWHQLLPGILDSKGGRGGPRF